MKGYGATRPTVLHRCASGPLDGAQTSRNRGSIFCRLAGQGATEYLVLLAVMLIVALVSVALLGFFPGMATDAQRTQSEIYWRSASPISIVESGARAYSLTGNTYLYLRFKNTGAYPVRITGIVGADGQKATVFQVSNPNCGALAGVLNISDYFYLWPGEEKFIVSWPLGAACDWRVYAITGASNTNNLGGASSICQNSSTYPGILDYKTLGFEYIQYMDGQQLAKRQIGKGLSVKCLPVA